VTQSLCTPLAAVFMIAKYNDLGFSLDGKEISIVLDSKDAHGGNSPWCTLLLEGTMLAKSKLLVSVHVLNA